MAYKTVHDQVPAHLSPSAHTMLSLQSPCSSPNMPSPFPLQSLYTYCLSIPSGVILLPAFHMSGFLFLHFRSSQKPFHPAQCHLLKHITLLYSFTALILCVHFLFSLYSGSSIKARTPSLLFTLYPQYLAPIRCSAYTC